MKKLALVLNDAPFLLSHRWPIVLAAKEAGYEIHILTPPHAASEKVFQEAGCFFHPIPLERKGTNPLNELALFWHMVKLYRSIRPDIVHHITIKPVLYGGIAARLLRIPGTVSAISGLGYVFIQNSVKARCLRLVITRLYRLALRGKNSRVIFQNTDDKALFTSLGLIRSEQARLVRGSSIDMDAFTIKPEPATSIKRVVLVSRMLWDKGVGEFVEAARLLKTEHIPVECILIGDTDEGNPASISKEQLERWKSEGIIAWWGKRSDIAAIFNDAHIVCLPSYREGLPRVLLEAAACGRAIITTDVPGCREVVRHGHNGLLVPVKETLPLAEAIKTLAQEEATRQEMGKASRQRAETEFSLKQLVPPTLQIYGEL